MTEEVQQPLAEVDSAPAPEVTATPEANQTPEVAEEAKEPSRVFTQEELDAAIGKRLARGEPLITVGWSLGFKKISRAGVMHYYGSLIEDVKSIPI